MTKRPYTVARLAEHWDCSDQHIYDEIAAGRIHCFRIGRLIRIPASEVERIEGGLECKTCDEASTEASSAPSGQRAAGPSVVPFVPPTLS